MNKYFYRIIFSKGPGRLIIVPDIAGAGRADMPSPPTSNGLRLQTLTGKIHAIGFALLLATGAILPVQAAILADRHAPGRQQPGLIHSANGTPQVNIQSPGAGGVSHNKYSQFDVDNKGIILNNSHKNVQTQLAGLVAGNPNLARGEAKVILNEVNSRNPSQLLGFVEVAGRRAEVVIANPSGITCNGCGFINASRTTLTTGQAEMNNGRISHYKVDRGEIIVDGAGMDSRLQDSTDLIARAVKINALIHASQLNVTAGRNIVDTSHDVISALESDGSISPEVAIDVAALGGMYANKIRLTGTEKGVGVHNAGNIGAQAGEVVVNADGSISNRGYISATQNVQLTTQENFDNQGHLYASANSIVNSRASVTNRGVLAAQNNIVVNAATINSHKTGVLAAGMGRNGVQVATGDLRLNSQGTLALNGKNSAAGTLIAQGTTLDLSDSQTSGNDISLRATSGDIRTSRATLSATRQLNAHTTATLDNNRGRISAGQLTLSGHSLSNQYGLIQQPGSSDLSLLFSGYLDNTGGTLASNGNNLHLKTARLTNQQGQIFLYGTGSLDIQATQLNGMAGTLFSDGGLTLDGGQLLLDNAVTRADRITLTADSLFHRGGNMRQTGSGDMSLTLSDIVDNQGGALQANGDLSLQAARLNNQNGSLIATENRSLRITTRHLLNNTQGSLAAGGELWLQSSGLNNDNGLLQSGRNMSLELDNSRLSNRSDSGKGGIFSQGILTLNSGAIDNTQGIISVAGDTQLEAATLNNRAGQIQVAGNAVINAINGLIDNTRGLIRSGQTLALTSGQLINQETQADNTGIESASVLINSGTIENNSGVILANGLLEISQARHLDNRSGLLSSGSVMNIRGQEPFSVNNTAGTLIAGHQLDLNAGALTGDGSILSQGTMTLVLQQAFFNQGSVIANGDTRLSTGRGLINQGLIKAGGVLTLTADTLDNQQQGEISAGENHLLLTGGLTNRGLLDGGLMHIAASDILNTGTGRLYGDRIALQTTALSNLSDNDNAATIAARDQLDIGAAEINNRGHGLIYSAGLTAIGGTLDEHWRATGQASVFNNHSATLESAGDMLLNIDQINNINDHLVTRVVVVENSDHHEAVLDGSVNRFDWTDIDTSYKNKYGVHDAIMPDGTRNNKFYEYIYTRTVTETQIVSSDPGQFIAGGHLTINSNQVNNHDSRIIAGGLLKGIITELNNIATAGQRVITDIGTQIRWYAKKSGGGFGSTKTSQGKDRSSYTPATTTRTIDLHTTTWQDNTPADGKNITIDERNKAGDNTTIIDAAGITAPVSPPPGQVVEVISPDDAEVVISIISPDTSLPANSLFRPAQDTGAGYLIETDPRFTRMKQWLSSAYMQQALANDPNALLKRLGDGYYEQQLIKQQVLTLTGSRYIKGYKNDEDQYLALMNAGISFAREYEISPGVALTPQQMALLTSDMVWLIKKEITLPDGTAETVLVPQVYLRGNKGAVDGSGALLGGDSIALNIRGDLTSSGHISGREVTQISADNINNSGFIGGNQVTLRAATDINNTGGTLQGEDRLTAIAGRDINSISTTGGSVGNITPDRPAGIYVQNDNGQLDLQAVRDITLAASLVSNMGAGSQMQIIAGNDLNLNTVTTTHSESGDWGGGNNRRLTQSTGAGSQINGSGDVSLVAGHDLNARAASVTAQDGLNVAAGNDLTISYGNDSYHLTENSHQSSGGLLSEKSVTTHDEIQNQSATGSTFSGNTVALQAGHDLTVTGSSVAGTHDVGLTAGNNLTINSADEIRQENHQYQEKKSGLSGTGGIGFSLGTSSLKTTNDGQTRSSAGSTVGSTQGNVNLTAGNGLTVKGSDLLAGKDLNLTGKEVNMLAADNQSSQMHRVEQKQSGLTLALSGTVGSAINTAVSSASDAGKQSSGRLAALQGMKAALRGVQAVQAVSLAEAAGSEGSMIGVNLSYGSQSSESTQTSTQNQSQGSLLMAGNSLNIHATATDINVQGSQLQAGKDAGLNAARDVNQISALNSQTLEGKNESHGASIGAGINVGQGANGLSLNASVNKGKGSESGNGTSHTETTVSAGNRLAIISGRDTTLTGAQVNGEKVTLDAGRNLSLTSEQDTDNYDSKQQNASAGGSVSMGGGSGSLNLSRDKMHSTYQSVQEQTGIFAGKNGFDITVGEHTQLNGAVIGSTADARLNTLNTGTLGFSNLKNSAEYEVEHQSAGISSGGSVGGQLVSNLANGLLAGINGSGSDSSATQSAVSEGTITLRDKGNQKQDMAELSRDVEHASQALSPVFDKEKQQNRLKEAQLIGEIGSLAGDIARTQGDINGLNAAKEKLGPLKDNATEKERAVYLNTLRNSDEYRAEMQKFGTGSTLQQGIQAATAAVQGLAGGNIAQAVSGAAAPYLAEQIHTMTKDNPEAQALAHAVVGAVTSYAAGNSALAGAAGAVSGELMAQLVMNQLYPDKAPGDLSETEKQTISVLGTLAAGLAGGVTGDSTADAMAGAQSGKNAVENNWLSLPSGMADYGQSASSLAMSMAQQGATPDEINTALSQHVKGDLPEGANITKAIVEGYTDGLMIGVAIYLGPAASIGKVVGGSVIAAVANGSYQWFDMSLSGNEGKVYDPLSTGAAAIMGGLAPGRGVWQNVGIAAGGAVFTDGPNPGTIGASAAGAWAGGMFGEYAPGIVNSIIRKELPGFIYDIGGAFASEAATDAGTSIIKKQESGK